MRYIKSDSLKAGMALGRSIYGPNGELILAKKLVLKPEYIEKIQNMGYNGLYIDDELSKEIEIRDVIQPELRQMAVKVLRENFCTYKDDAAFLLDEEAEMIKEIVTEIVEDIISQNEIMLNMVDLKVYDNYTYYHSVNVAALAVSIGLEMGLNKDSLKELGIAAILHDIGKKVIPEEILHKPGKLTTEEFEVIKRHPTVAYDSLKESRSISSVARVAILQHHERFDGTGYPLGRKGTEISMFARILSVADVYDALASKRSYHDAWPPSDALEYIMAGSGSQFDPDIVMAFSRKVAIYPIGTIVELSNGKFGMVVQNYPEYNSRPKVKIIGEEQEEEYYDLRESSMLNITIMKMANS